MVENTLLELAASDKKRKMPRCSPMKNISRSRRSRLDGSSWRLQEGRKRQFRKKSRHTGYSRQNTEVSLTVRRCSRFVKDKPQVSGADHVNTTEKVRPSKLV